MNRIMRHFQPSVGVVLTRISALYVGETVHVDTYYVGRNATHHLNPILRELWSRGFIPYWEYVGAILPVDRDRGFIAIGDVEVPTTSIDELSDQLNDLEFPEGLSV